MTISRQFSTIVSINERNSMKIYKKKPWTPEERRILKLFYNVINNEDLQAKLSDRSMGSITNQVHFLKRRGWTFKTKEKDGK